MPLLEDISTGAYKDLVSATALTHSMVKKVGMTSKVGKVYFAQEKNRFLNLGLEDAEEYSRAITELIDNEVREIIEQQY